MNIDYQNGILLPTFLKTIAESPTVFSKEFSKNFFLVVNTEKDKLVYPVWKTHRNIFPAGITLGRGLVNDICIASEAVSKIHAYFRRVNEQWVLIDHYSTRGTWIEDQKVSAGQDYVLSNRTRLKFGSLKAMFLSCNNLLELKDQKVSRRLPTGLGKSPF